MMNLTIQVAAVKKTKHGSYGKRLMITAVQVQAEGRSINFWENQAHDLAAAVFAAELPGLKITTEIVGVTE